MHPCTNKYMGCHFWLVLRRRRLILLILTLMLGLSLLNLSLMFYSKSVAPKSLPPTNDLERMKVNNTLFDIQGVFLFKDSLTDDQSLLPFEPNGSRTDRILNQMRLIPRGYSEAYKMKVIFVEDSNRFPIDISMCPVKRCQYTFLSQDRGNADAVLIRSFSDIPSSFGASQIVILYMLESPHNVDMSQQANIMMLFNWTATYRFDSEIVAPYFKMTAYDNRRPWPSKFPTPKEDFSSNRTGQIAWFVSNCQTANRRDDLAAVLGRYLKVDIYGGCGSLTCGKEDEACFVRLRNYWFYLSLENSNCRHYITEKFFRNALKNSVVPIVYGAHPDDYRLVAPLHSYIHVEDFRTIESLVAHLKHLMANKTAYNEYFAWRPFMKVDTNTFFWCRLCTMVHHAAGRRQPEPLRQRRWWTVTDSCTVSPWTVPSYW